MICMENTIQQINCSFESQSWQSLGGGRYRERSESLRTIIYADLPQLFKFEITWGQAPTRLPKCAPLLQI